ncbi:MAG: hypothetical protein KJ077_12365 [Anaerolineae bacterium]|nr:hypothetical protein [Anaerolineae bacterium]
MHLSQPVFDEIINPDDNASLEIEETSPIRLARKKTRTESVRHFVALEQLYRYGAYPASVLLNTYPGLFFFTDKTPIREVETTGIDFEHRSTQEPSRIEVKYYSARKTDVTLLARRELYTIANKEMAKEAKKILDEVRNLLNEIDTSNLPPIRFFEAQDGSLLLEWMLPHHRVGFSIEASKEESSWFLVSDNYAQRTLASGLLDSENIAQIAWIIQPIIDYYI